MELVTIAQFPTTVEAMLAKNLLDENGIKAELADENIGDLFHLAANFGEVKLMVQSDHAEQAAKLLQDAHQHKHDEDKPDSEES